MEAMEIKIQKNPKKKFKRHKKMGKIKRPGGSGIWENPKRAK